MIFSCISDEEKALLKRLVGKKINCIKSEERDSWNRIFGNLEVIADDYEVEIRNELTETEYFGDTEDVSKFKIRKITSDAPFALIVEAPVYETKIDNFVTDVIIVQDEITVKDSEGKPIYEITMDEAIVIKMTNSTYVISREWCLEEELIFLKTANYKESVYSVEDVASEWSDDDDGLVASCHRSELSLVAD
ncbi:MAG: hypothetical protein KBT02_08410 [Treponema sp.]|nr:hypothetical protein [Candidatus Treponema caballi]